MTESQKIILKDIFKQSDNYSLRNLEFLSLIMKQTWDSQKISYFDMYDIHQLFFQPQVGGIFLLNFTTTIDENIKDINTNILTKKITDTLNEHDLNVIQSLDNIWLQSIEIFYFVSNYTKSLNIKINLKNSRWTIWNRPLFINNNLIIKNKKKKIGDKIDIITTNISPQENSIKLNVINKNIKKTNEIIEKTTISIASEFSSPNNVIFPGDSCELNRNDLWGAFVSGIKKEDFILMIKLQTKDFVLLYRNITTETIIEVIYNSAYTRSNFTTMDMISNIRNNMDNECFKLNTKQYNIILEIFEVNTTRINAKDICFEVKDFQEETFDLKKIKSGRFCISTRISMRFKVCKT